MDYDFESSGAQFPEDYVTAETFSKIHGFEPLPPKALPVDRAKTVRSEN